MIETNKNQYLPDGVSSPGETLSETLEELEISQAQLAERMGRPKKTINEIIKGKTAITPETALQLEKVLGVPASFWNNRERLYREAIARQNEKTALAGYVDWAKKFPIKELVKRAWLPPCPTPTSAADALLRFFAIAKPEQLPQVCQVARFRKSENSKTEPLLAWLRQGKIEGQKVRCEPFNKTAFEELLSRARSWTRLSPNAFQPLLVNECAKTGVAVVFVPELKGSGAFGATVWLSPNKAMIQLSLRYKTNDHLWFTFFHEAEHILRHGHTRNFIESKGMENTAEESEANKFAALRLIPVKELHRFLNNGKAISATTVTTFADSIGIAPGIVVGRLQHDGKLSYKNLNHLKVTLKWTE
jgi:addiction module HigA family antidote